MPRYGRVEPASSVGSGCALEVAFLLAPEHRVIRHMHQKASDSTLFSHDA
jgi:hypothetical protein